MTHFAENDALPNGCCHPPADHSAHVRHTAEKDVPTERDWLIEILGRVNGVNAQRPKQRQAIEQIYRREIAAIIEGGWESDESIALRERMADLLTRTANALKGDPGPLRSHDWSDLPDVAASRVTSPERTAE